MGEVVQVLCRVSREPSRGREGHLETEADVSDGAKKREALPQLGVSKWSFAASIRYSWLVRETLGVIAGRTFIHLRYFVSIQEELLFH